jgi:hypothetical protein
VTACREARELRDENEKLREDWKTVKDAAELQADAEAPHGLWAMMDGLERVRERK